MQLQLLADQCSMRTLRYVKSHPEECRKPSSASTVKVFVVLCVRAKGSDVGLSKHLVRKGDHVVACLSWS